MQTIRDIMNTAPVIPVIVIDDPVTAIPLAKALVQGGLKVLEITLRTDAAMQAIADIAHAVPEAIVGVGTVNRCEHMQEAKSRGAQFAVSPGYTPQLGAAANQASLPYLPGIMTPSEILLAMHDGLDALKFFPASKAGGPDFLKNLAGPFQDVVFCPTGGINADNSRIYLALDNVLCVGGSWVAPESLVKTKDWDAITSLATNARALRR